MFRDNAISANEINKTGKKNKMLRHTSTSSECEAFINFGKVRSMKGRLTIRYPNVVAVSVQENIALTN